MKKLLISLPAILILGYVAVYGDPIYTKNQDGTITKSEVLAAPEISVNADQLGAQIKQIDGKISDCQAQLILLTGKKSKLQAELDSLINATK